MRKIALCLITLLVLGCLLLTACPGSVTTTTPPTTTPPLTGGGTLNLTGTDPTTLDPALASDANSGGYIIQIFSGLVKLDKDLEPVADIAQSWDISQDGRVFTFYLREDVVFQDGRQVKAADFKYSWERACNPATGSQVASTYLGDIVGANAMLAGQATEISGIVVVNDYTLQITIDAPKTYFLSKLTYPTGMVVDRNNVAAGASWWRTPNGTGPFKLKQWTQSSLIVLERNNSYYGQKASLEFVNFQMYSGNTLSLYETGQIDVAGVSATYIDTITDTAGAFYNEYYSSPLLSFYWIGFNTAKPPFDDVNVRKAFSMAVDKDKMISLTLRDLVQRADGILPPGIPGYNENLDGLEFNVEKAKELIAASKYGSVENLPQITFTTSGYGGAISQTLEAMITQWRDNLGVEVQVRQLEPSFYLYYLQSEVDNMYDMGWIADYPHPQDFLDVLFYTGVQYNYGRYSNLAMDALLDQAGVEQNTAQSWLLYQQAEQMIVNDAAALPLWFSRNYILVKPYVVGYELNALGYVMLKRLV
jgi:oligopeptide transport system substrate-binding protein